MFAMIQSKNVAGCISVLFKKCFGMKGINTNARYYTDTLLEKIATANARSIFPLYFKSKDKK